MFEKAAINKDTTWYSHESCATMGPRILGMMDGRWMSNLLQLFGKNLEVENLEKQTKTLGKDDWCWKDVEKTHGKSYLRWWSQQGWSLPMSWTLNLGKEFGATGRCISRFSRFSKRCLLFPAYSHEFSWPCFLQVNDWYFPTDYSLVNKHGYFIAMYL